MERLLVSLENCYGIKKFDYEFDYQKNNAYLIYASNGVMKTSFAKTFKQLSLNKKPTEEAFNRETTWSIKKEDDTDLLSHEIFVINSYEDEYISPNSAKLMVSKDLKEKHDRELLKVNMLKEGFVSEVRNVTNSNMDVVKEITSAFAKQPIDFLDLLLELYDNGVLSKSGCGLDFKEISYNDIFNDGVKKFISDPKNLKQIQEYNNLYTELLKNTKIFKRGVFSPYNAESITNDLINNGFFSAEHEIKLNGIDETIRDADQLINIISKERNKIFDDIKLRAKFDKIDKELNKRALISFRKIIEKYPEVILQLEDFAEFKETAWVSILKATHSQYEILAENYKTSKKVVEEIKLSARNEKTQWERTLEIFNKRFKVPLIVEVPNQDDVLLNESIPEFVFKFYDEDTKEEAPMLRKNLENILSQGEKRSLYLLNIINDLEALKSEGKEVLIVADDIAESFDYKNKYAIIQYLHEISQEANFKLIILTHNFDFFRTTATRMSDVIFPQMVSKDVQGITLQNPKYVFNNPFGIIKKGLATGGEKAIITAIPFVRNIIEYTQDTACVDYLMLTSLLHMKNDTKLITINDLEDIFNRTLSTSLDFSKNYEKKPVFNLVMDQANEIIQESIETIDLDGKIILSIAIRLMAESFMINEISKLDGNFMEIDEIRNSGKPQSGKLLELFKNKLPGNIEMISILDEVNLMTSENIHINSFMFEPIIDMSIISLINLFRRFQLICPFSEE